jgi:hypothetical protein
VEVIADAIYDGPVAFSLRDRDDGPYDIDDKPIVKRMRLFCRASENLILADDTLSFLGTDWTTMQSEMANWIKKYEGHAQHQAMQEFASTGYDRLAANVKELRNIFMMLAGSRKQWEVAVGQVIAHVICKDWREGNGSVVAFLGPKLVSCLGLKKV